MNISKKETYIPGATTGMTIDGKRFFTFFMLIGAVSVILAGCVLSPGNSESTAVPTTTLTPDNSSQYSSLFATPIEYKADSASYVVTFSHATHVNKAKQSCDACHLNNSPWSMLSGIVKGSLRGKAASSSYTMNDMYGTASSTGLGCGKCHNGTQAFSVKTACFNCHTALGGITFKPSMGNVLFSHKMHVTTMSIACDDCHKGNTPWPMKYQDPFFRSPNMHNGCGICHKTNGRAFDTVGNCSTKKCHQ